MQHSALYDTIFLEYMFHWQWNAQSRNSCWNISYWAVAITVYSSWHCYSNTPAPQHIPHTCNVYFEFLWLTLRLFPISSLQLFVKINYTQHGPYWVSSRFWHTGCRIVGRLARACKYCELWIDPQCMFYNVVWKKKYGRICEMYSFWPEMIKKQSSSLISSIE